FLTPPPPPDTYPLSLHDALPISGAGLLATLNSVWGPIAARGLMPVTPTLLPGDAAAGRGSTMSTPIYSGKSLEGFLVVQRRVDRSEEHTSELQSRSDLVCRLLLE